MGRDGNEPIFKESEDPYMEDPNDVKTFSFSPNGDVLNGNVYQDAIMDILNVYSAM